MIKLPSLCLVLPSRILSPADLYLLVPTPFFPSLAFLLLFSFLYIRNRPKSQCWRPSAQSNASINLKINRIFTKKKYILVARVEKRNGPCCSAPSSWFIATDIIRKKRQFLVCGMGKYRWERKIIFIKKKSTLSFRKRFCVGGSTRQFESARLFLS